MDEAIFVLGWILVGNFIIIIPLAGVRKSGIFKYTKNKKIKKSLPVFPFRKILNRSEILLEMITQLCIKTWRIFLIYELLENVN